MQMDKETIDIQREGQMIEDFCKSEGWTWIKDRLMERVMDLQSIRNIDVTKLEDLVSDIKARNTAVEILLETIKQVEGRASQHSNNNHVNIREEEIILIQR